MLKIGQSRDCIIFNMGIPIPGKAGLYIETGPWMFLLGNALHHNRIAYCQTSNIRSLNPKT